MKVTLDRGRYGIVLGIQKKHKYLPLYVKGYHLFKLKELIKWLKLP